MEDALVISVLVVYGICVLIWSLYTFSMIHLIYYVVRDKILKKKRSIPQFEEGAELPLVTVQLPMYNEFHVAEGVIDACAQFDYPGDKFEIQVLDDSTDESKDIVDARVAYWQEKGVDIKVIRREKREGFKAGALAYATPMAKGEFIAIFDADFKPSPDFLMKALPYFNSEDVGVIQGRWGHANRDYSLLTRLQALALDSFYLIEQKGRIIADYYTRFNGSGGIWRKTAIEDAGGWTPDTLCEDLDLGYRAQLKGWKFKYADEIVCDGEVPVTMSGLKSQHYRWHKGKAEVVKKLLGNVMKAKIPFMTKVHAMVDLLNIWATAAILGLGLFSVPFSYIYVKYTEYHDYIVYFSIALIHTPIIIYMIYYVLKFKYKSRSRTVLEFFKQFPPFTFLFTGIAIVQCIGIVDGFRGKTTPFIRTPKYNLKTRSDVWRGKKYSPKTIPRSTYFEAFLFLFFVGGLIIDFVYGAYAFVLFHSFLTAGSLYAFGLTFAQKN